MKYLPFLLLSLVLLVSCGQQSGLLITNHSDQAVYGKRITVNRSLFEPVDVSYFTLSYGGNELPVQFDDLDGDGAWDEVAFLLDMAPNEEVRLSLAAADSRPEYEKKTDVFLGLSPERNNQFEEVQETERPRSHVAMSTPYYLYQYEGPGWESELVAFRTYFDSRNGKDIFGKTQPQLYVSKIGLGDNYHELADWGMDVLKVGNSLGAGALAIVKNDSIYRLGDTGGATFKSITEGPVRAILELKYTGWDVDGQSYDLKETISIWAGKRSYTSTIELGRGNKSDTLVTGIVDLKEVGQYTLDTAGYHVLYTHGKQSENNDVLGMGVLVSDASFSGFGTAPEEGDGVTNTYTAMLKSSNGVYEYHFFAGWELENRDYKTVDKFKEALQQEAASLAAEVSVLHQ